MKNNTKKVSNNSFFEVINNLLKKKDSFICSRLPGSKQVNLNSGIVTKLKRSEIQDNGIFVMPFIEKNLGWMLSPSLNYETIIEKKLNSKNNNFLNVKVYKSTLQPMEKPISINQFHAIKKHPIFQRHKN